MQKKYLNTFILISQWILTIALGIYLIVPIYGPIKSRIIGDSFYSPYENWEKSPLTPIHLNKMLFLGTNPDSVLGLNPFVNQASILILDTLKEDYINPFLFGQSSDDIQYLLKAYDVGERSVYNSHTNSEDSTLGIKSVSMQLIESKNDFKYIDQSLAMGIPLHAIAGKNDSLFSVNFLMTPIASPKESISALREGRNLLAFSKNENFYLDYEKIPVIRNIQWKNNILKIDLSEEGNIRVISSGFSVDTLASNLSLKLNKPKWFRFEVDFKEDEIFYFSNPFYRFSKTPFATVYPKAKNQLTIFINLSWLIIIVLLNTLISRIRKKFL